MRIPTMGVDGRGLALYPPGAEKECLHRGALGVGKPGRGIAKPSFNPQFKKGGDGDVRFVGGVMVG